MCFGKPSYSAEWLRECEVRYVAKLPDHLERMAYLAKVLKARGKDVAKRLREDAWTELQA